MKRPPGARQIEILEALLHRRDGLTADQIADQVSVTRSAAHQHLSALQAEGLVERREFAASGGRPSHVYALTEAGAHVFPKKYDWFAELLIRKVEATFGADAAAQMLVEIGREVGRASAAAPGGDMAQRVEAAVGLMNRLGFSAQAETGQDGAPEITALNCIWHRLAAAHPEVCKLDIALIGELVGEPVEQAECMLRGGARCRFRHKSGA